MELCRRRPWQATQINPTLVGQGCSRRPQGVRAHALPDDPGLREAVADQDEELGSREWLQRPRALELRAPQGSAAQARKDGVRGLDLALEGLLELNSPQLEPSLKIRWDVELRRLGGPCR